VRERSAAASDGTAVDVDVGIEAKHVGASTPLKVKLLLATRPPLALGLTLALLFESRLLISASTPGSIKNNWVKLCEEVGRFSRSRSSSSRTMTTGFPTTMSASAVTTTVSVWRSIDSYTGNEGDGSVLTLTPPGSRFGSLRPRWPRDRRRRWGRSRRLASLC